MFKVGEYIIYSSTGVCKIEDIRTECFNGTKKSYYILKPVYLNSSTIYTPVGSSEERMKKIISKKDVYKLIQSLPGEKMEWIENDRARKEKYSEIVKLGNRKDLIRLLKTLHQTQREKIATGKRFHCADERIMKEIEKILFEEFALVLDISVKDVPQFIQGELEEQGYEQAIS